MAQHWKANLLKTLLSGGEGCLPLSRAKLAWVIVRQSGCVTARDEFQFGINPAVQ
jgi:hypothetical protein